MEKNTVIAILLSIVVITGGMFIQTKYFLPSDEELATAQAQEDAEAASQAAQLAKANDNISTSNSNGVDASTIEYTGSSESVYVAADKAWNSGLPGSIIAVDDNTTETSFVYETNVFSITFDTKGASVSSIKLKEHSNTDGEPVDLIYKGDSSKNAFLMYAGKDRTNPIDTNFNYEIKDNKVIFTKTFATLDADGKPASSFDVVKTYTLGDNDYLFQVDIEMSNSINKALPLNFENEAYTLAFEPQIGPVFDTMPNNNYTYRRFYAKYDGSDKKKQLKVSDSLDVDEYVTWTALAGKYFSVIAIPDATKYDITLTQQTDVDGMAQFNGMFYTRPTINSAYSKDTFRFYVGPQLASNMKIYNNKNDNGFGLSDLHLETAVDTSTFLNWLEVALKWSLEMLYKIVPNYGVAIILLTIILKALLTPLTTKSMESSKKMSALQPQMKELQEKYKDNPDRLNKETSALYQREKINPLGGCLPMLIQFPILIAFYGLLNKNFELRGAMFIPGWIPDLSQPDTVLTWGATIPFIGNQLHLLPIFYTISMIFSMKITQTGQTAGQTESMMKIMTYGMPIMFFFVLYDAPSGLLLYWSVMNAISIGQQFYTNHKKEPAKAPSNVKAINASKNKKKNK
ncbi:MAG: membrane protein insertase YidC [Sphaerochaetaceae bacterium]|nr:membrane protein insertase YidC [Sphaerochaetaceae bacterium]